MAAAADPALAQIATRTKMRVGVHANVNPMPLTAITSRFSNASTAFTADAGVNDVACNLTLQRLDAGYGFYGGGSSDIPSTEVEYLATRDNTTDAYMVVVNQLNWCQGTQPVAGCAFDSGSNQRKPFLVNRAVVMDNTEGGVIIAHEFGHSQGLNHDDQFALQIMNTGTLSSSTRVKDSATCNTFRLPFQLSCPSGLAGPAGSAICSPDQASPLAARSTSVDEQGTTESDPEIDFTGVPIEELARILFVDRVPAEVEDYYGEKDVAILRDLLRDKRNEANERTILTLIGLISDGNDEDVLVLADVGAGGNTDINAAGMALGMIVSRTGNELALDVLKQRFASEVASIVRAAQLGLTLSGDPEAFAILSEAALDATSREAATGLALAAEENQRIANISLREHYLHPPEAAVFDNPRAGEGFAWPLPEDDEAFFTE